MTKLHQQMTKLHQQKPLITVYYPVQSRLKLARARIGSILDLSTVDWPGRISSVIFMAGCNLRCPYCQNASLVSTESGELVEVSKVLRRITSNMTMIDAVGFCGGEPTLQEEPLVESCHRLVGIGLKTFVNTNGTHPEVIKRLVENGLISFVTIDVKAPLDAQSYRKVTGREVDESLVDRVRESLRICTEKHIELEIRTTIVPTISDELDFTKSIAHDLPKNVRYVLQQFNPKGDIIDQRLRDMAAPSIKQMRSLGRVASEEGLLNVYIRTSEGGEERISN